MTTHNTAGELPELITALREEATAFEQGQDETDFGTALLLAKAANALDALARQEPVTERATEYPEAPEVCAEAYQVVGSLLLDVGAFDTEKGKKVLDNLSEHRLVHDDVLPWPSFTPAAAGVPELKDRLLVALERAAWAETALRELADECDNDMTPHCEDRMSKCLKHARSVLSATYENQEVPEDEQLPTGLPPIAAPEVP